MKTVKVDVRFDGEDARLFDKEGNEYAPIVDDYGDIENVLRQVSELLRPLGVELVLGDVQDFYAVRLNKLEGK